MRTVVLAEFLSDLRYREPQTVIHETRKPEPTTADTILVGSIAFGIVCIGVLCLVVAFKKLKA